jgi:hypothetical protein
MFEKINIQGAIHAVDYVAKTNKPMDVSFSFNISEKTKTYVKFNVLNAE